DWSSDVCSSDLLGRVASGRGAGVDADVESLVDREIHRRRCGHAPFALHLAVDCEADHAALGITAAVVIEIHLQDASAGVERPLAHEFDRVGLEGAIAESGTSLGVEIERPPGW